MNKVFVVVLCLVAHLSFAADEVKELPPLDPTYMGVHTMVLFERGSKIYASHLPSYTKPNNLQLLYKLDNKNLAILQTIRDSSLVTIKLKPFNLQRLIRGEKAVINADLYSGHFDRGGMLVYEDIALSFEKQLYLRELDDIEPSSTKQVYDVVSLGKGYMLYIHNIQQAPSFDHILGVDLQAGCLASFNTSSAVPKETEIQYKFLNCGTLKPLYFETEDFQHGPAR